MNDDFENDDHIRDEFLAAPERAARLVAWRALLRAFPSFGVQIGGHFNERMPLRLARFALSLSVLMQNEEITETDSAHFLAAKNWLEEISQFHPFSLFSEWVLSSPLQRDLRAEVWTNVTGTVEAQGRGVRNRRFLAARTPQEFFMLSDLGEDSETAMWLDLPPGRKNLLKTPLWSNSDQIEGGAERYVNLAEVELDSYFEGSLQDFWRSWYQGFLDGDPMNWELQRRVALIKDVIWEEGPKAVAEEIERIRKAFDVEQAAKDVAGHLGQRPQDVILTEKPMMGHNQPPEDARLPITEVQFDRFNYAITVIQTQSATTHPDLSQVREAAEIIEEVETTSRSWLAEKAGMSVDAFFKQLGKRGGDLAWLGAVCGAVWLFDLWQKLQPLIGLIRQWITLLMA